MIKSTFICLFFLTFLSSFVLAQKSISQFNVSVDGKIIGEMEATKEVNGSDTKFSLHSNVDTKIMTMSIEVESELVAFTKDQILIEGKSFQHSNRKKANISASIKKTGANTYDAIKNGKASVINASKITFSVTDMYFQEPVGITTVFSIADADFLSVRPLGEGKYELLLSNGKRNVFSYSNGVLIRMEAPIVLGRVLIIRK